MQRLALLLALGMATCGALAQREPPPIVFFDEQVMSEKRALEIAELARKRFWGNVPGFDGKTKIEPTSEEERQSIPIQRWDLLYIALTSSHAGDAKRCNVETADGFLDRHQRTFYRRYPQEKQVQFAIAYSILIFRDVVGRMKDVACSSERANALRKSIELNSQ